MAEGVSTMAESNPTGPIPAPLLSPAEVGLQAPLGLSPNGIRFATFGDVGVGAAPTPALAGSPADPHSEIARLVQAVPTAIAAALTGHTYYFVPLVLTEARAAQPPSPSVGQPNPQPGAQPPATANHRASRDETMIAPAYTPALADLAICHRNIELDSTEAVFISTRLLSDRFSLAFEFFINVGHAFVDTAGIPQAFADLAWSQALADVRGETSHDAWETRALALNGNPPSRTLSGGERGEKSGASFSRVLALSAAEGQTAETSASSSQSIDEKARNEFLEAAFADAVAIYLLSLAVDFDYSELREREYPLLAPHALAERLRLTHNLFPPNPGYDFAIRYRRRP
jgi:hypothetical protein